MCGCCCLLFHFKLKMTRVKIKSDDGYTLMIFFYTGKFKHFKIGENLVVRPNSSFYKIGCVYKNGDTCYTENIRNKIFK